MSRPSPLPALPPDIQTPAYVLDAAALARNMNVAARVRREAGCKMLLLTMDYPQEQMAGPPFAVAEPEVQALFARDFSVRLLTTRDALLTDGAANDLLYGYKRCERHRHRRCCGDRQPDELRRDGQGPRRAARRHGV